MTYIQYEVNGRWVIKVTTKGGKVYYGDSAHELSGEEIVYNWINYKNNKDYWRQAHVN